MVSSGKEKDVMIESEKVRHILYGGDYNPEQWPEESWSEDMRLLKEAGVNIVTLNVFSWASIQPDENTYDFDRLDRIMELVRENRMAVCMATGTGAHPAWMAKKYPEILRTEFGGQRRKFGGRHNSCPNSPIYRTFAKRLAEKLAQHYQDRDNIVSWHISNEFGGECYCENCERAFRQWLKKRYGTLDELNRRWYTSFWGHTFYDWEEIVPPDTRSEHIDEKRTMFQGITLDYKRFLSDSMLEAFRLEYEAVKAVIPDARITTNLMGFYPGLDYQKWADHMDFVSVDSYPANEDTYADVAMAHDLMRGLKQGKPFALMEQTPSVTNWLPYNALKRPGIMRLWSHEAMAHGADTVMFFQMKRSLGGCEKHHGAFIDHVGTGQTRVYREAAALGAELSALGGQLLGARTPAKIGMLFDWDNWWALTHSAGPSCELDYVQEWKRCYRALRERNYEVDIVSSRDDFSGYRILLAPVWYMVKGQDDEAVRRFVAEGGAFVTGFFSGIVQENDLAVTGGYPGKLRDILGIWVEECDALPHDVENSFVYQGVRYPARILCDLLHTEGAVQMDDSGYETDFYRGYPVLTKHSYGKGIAYYMATSSSDDFYRKFLEDICQEAGVQPVLRTPSGVEAASRVNQNGAFIWLLNHTEEPQEVCLPWEGLDVLAGSTPVNGTITILPRDVRILLCSAGCSF